MKTSKNTGERKKVRRDDRRKKRISRREGKQTKEYSGANWISGSRDRLHVLVWPVILMIE